MGFVLLGSSAAFVNATTVTVGSNTYIGGDTYLIFLGTTAAANPTDNPSISAGSLTLTKRGTIAGGNRRIIVYSFTPASNTTTGMVFTYAESQLRQFFAIYRGSTMTGFNTINVVTNSGVSANPLITLPSTATSHTVGYFMNNTNPFNATPESGWTEDFDTGLGGPVGNASYSRISTTDNTIQLIAISSDWIGLGIQYSLITRRIYIC